MTVPHVFPSDHSERAVAPARRQTVSRPVVSAPAAFNPLVPYAAFGWLPAGFSEGAAAGIKVNEGFTSGTAFTGMEAADLVAGHLVYLQVNARGACPFTVAAARPGVRSGKDVPGLGVRAGRVGFAGDEHHSGGG